MKRKEIIVIVGESRTLSLPTKCHDLVFNVHLDALDVAVREAVSILVYVVNTQVRRNRRIGYP